MMIARLFNTKREGHVLYITIQSLEVMPAEDPNSFKITVNKGLPNEYSVVGSRHLASEAIRSIKEHSVIDIPWILSPEQP